MSDSADQPPPPKRRTLSEILRTIAERPTSNEASSSLRHATTSESPNEDVIVPTKSRSAGSASATPKASSKPSSKTAHPPQNVKAQAKQSAQTLLRWISNPELRCTETDMMPFQIEADGGILCKLCSKHQCHGDRGDHAKDYSVVSVIPTRADRLTDHLGTTRHSTAIEAELTQRTSTFHKQVQERAQFKIKTIGQRLHTIYWLVKEEIANRKLPSLQRLIDRISNNDLLRDFRHTSSTSTLEFILLISENITDSIIADIETAGVFAIMCDETSDVANLQQYITYVRYVKDGKPNVRFLDIRRMGDGGATGQKLYEKFVEVADDYGLNLDHLVGCACDGAAAMHGRHNSLCSRLLAAHPGCLAIHCMAHRLALACADTSKQLTQVQQFERHLLQVWAFFSRSPLKSAKLATMQGLLETAKYRLQRLCATRWLSSQKAVVAMMSEIIAVWASLEQIGAEKDDQQAIGLLKCIKKKRFVVTLYLLDTALPFLTRLCETFQSASLNFAHMEFALLNCKTEIETLSKDQKARQALVTDWQKFEAHLQEWTEDDRASMDKLTKVYCENLISKLDDRFPEPEVLSAFRVFDANTIPESREERTNYAVADLTVLANKFQVQDPGKLLIDWASFAERLVMLKRDQPSKVENAAKVCSVVVTDPFYTQAWPEIVTLAKIALTIPLTSVDPERGFSHLKLIKTVGRSRLLDETLAALMNISINGPSELSDGDADAIAQKWLGKKARRRVTARGEKNVREFEKKRAELKRKQDEAGREIEIAPGSEVEEEELLGFTEADIAVEDELEFEKFLL